MSYENPNSKRKNQQAADALAAMAGAAPPPDPLVPETPPAVEADDQMNAPAPTLETFVKKPHRPSGKSKMLDRSIETRRTLIPILLTMGVMLPVVGSLKWFTSAESPFAAWHPAAAGALILTGIVLLFFAILNMSQVQKMLQQRQRHAV